MHELPLDGLWRCAADPFGLGQNLNYTQSSIDDADWRLVSLPGTVPEIADGFLFGKGKIWFRREVDIPEAWKGRRITLEGDGLFENAKIHINGIEAGHANLPYLPWEAEIKAEAGAHILIVLELDCTQNKDRCPGTWLGWRAVSGILRSLRLKATAWTTMQISSLATDGAGNLAATIQLQRHSEKSSLPPALRWRVETLEGNQLAKGEEKVSADCLQIACKVPGVRPWRTFDPALYRLIVESADASVEPLERNIGFRKIAVENGKLCLDGQAIQLAGANMHEDRPGGEFRYTPETLRDLLHMKNLGANCVRLCHYPHDTRTLDACDRIGLYAFAEVPLYGPSSKERADHAAEQVKAMIARDIHHPSIIIWSMSNETGSNPEMNGRLVKLGKSLDPNRPVTHVSHTFLPSPDFEEDDMVCVNGYPSWLMKSDKNYKDVTDPGAWWHDKLAELHAIYPGKPILVTEFGHPAISGGPAGKCDEEAQALAISREAKGFTHPFICGTLVWCWADHLWPMGCGMGGLSVSVFGLLTRERKPKRALEEASKAWRARLGKG